MYSIFVTHRFKKDYKKLSDKDKITFKKVITKLSKNIALDKKFKDHKLSENWNNCRECHLKPDLLLIYSKNKSIMEIALIRVGSHSSLFQK